MADLAAEVEQAQREEVSVVCSHGRKTGWRGSELSQFVVGCWCWFVNQGAIPRTAVCQYVTFPRERFVHRPDVRGYRLTCCKTMVEAAEPR